MMPIYENQNKPVRCMGRGLSSYKCLLRFANLTYSKKKKSLQP